MAGSGTSFTPKFRLYSSDGLTLIYTFPAVNFTNAPQSVPNVVEIQNTRSDNAILIDGGNDKPFDLQLNFVLSGNGYIEVTDKIEDLENSITPKVAYLLRIQKSGVAFDEFEIKVKRTVPFTYAESLRISTQPVVAVFRANSW